MNFGAAELGKVILGIVLAVGLVPFSIYTRDRVTVDEVRTTIDRRLARGASAQEIETVLERQGIAFTYSATQDRYQCIIRDISPYSFIEKSIRIYVYTDTEKKFVRAEIFPVYTFL